MFCLRQRVIVSLTLRPAPSHQNLVIFICYFTPKPLYILTLYSLSPIQVDATSGRSYSFNQLKDFTQRLSSALIKRGFKKRDVLAIYLPNVIEYPVIFFGVAFIGGVCTTVNPLYSSQELARQLRITRAKYVVTIPPLAENARDAAASEGVRSVFVIGKAPGCESLSDLLSDDGTAFPEHVDINPMEDMVGFSLPFTFHFV